MTGFLLKKFIKDYKNVENPQVRISYGKFSGIVGIITNIMLSIIKIIAGILSSSIAIVADGFNNLTDASSSIMTLVGFKLASKPEDKNHPYGHARMEYLTGLMISLLILILGAVFLKASIEKIIHPISINYSVVSIIILAVSIIIKLWQYRFYLFTSRSIDSQTLKAAAIDSRNDVLATGIILLGIMISKITGYNLDGFLGVLIGIIILLSGISLIKETSNLLLGKAPDPIFVKIIKDKILSYDGIYGIHDMVIHDYGPGRIFATVHIEVDSRKDILVSHELVDFIENQISQEFNINLVAHMDPIIIDDPLINALSSELSCICSLIPGVKSFHDLRVVEGKSRTNVIFDIIKEASCPLDDEGLLNIFNVEINNRKKFIKKKVNSEGKDFDENIKLKAIITIDTDFADI